MHDKEAKRIAEEIADRQAQELAESGLPDRERAMVLIFKLGMADACFTLRETFGTDAEGRAAARMAVKHVAEILAASADYHGHDGQN